VLFQAMAGGDPFLLEVARRAVLANLTDLPAVTYRQDILRDYIGNAAIVRKLYSLAVETIEREKKLLECAQSQPGLRAAPIRLLLPQKAAHRADPIWMKLFIRYTLSLRAKRSNLGRSSAPRSRLLRRLRLLAMTPFAWLFFLLAKRSHLDTEEPATTPCRDGRRPACWRVAKDLRSSKPS
jgi:hypothetical protein